MAIATAVDQVGGRLPVLEGCIDSSTACLIDHPHTAYPHTPLTRNHLHEFATILTGCGLAAVREA